MVVIEYYLNNIMLLYMQINKFCLYHKYWFKHWFKYWFKYCFKYWFSNIGKFHSLFSLFLLSLLRSVVQLQDCDHRRNQFEYHLLLSRPVVFVFVQNYHHDQFLKKVTSSNLVFVFVIICLCSKLSSRSGKRSPRPILAGCPGVERR